MSLLFLRRLSSFPEETKNSFSSFLLISLEIGLRGFVVSVLSILLFKLQQVCATPLPLVAGTTAQLNLTQTPETSIVPLTVDASIPLSHSIFLNRICLATLARPTMFRSLFVDDRRRSWLDWSI